MIRFLVNPAAGRGAGAARLHRLRILASRAGAGLVTSKNAEDLAEQARRAVADGVERLVVAGGDGTVHYAAQGLAGSACALAVVPVGSGNDFAGTLGVPRQLESAVEWALTRPIRRIDLVRVGDKVAIGYAGVGFDSEVTKVANQVRRLRGPLVYVYALVRVLGRFQAPGMRVEHDKDVFEGKAMFAVAANLPRFGGGMKIAPQARIDDGQLDLILASEIPKLTLLRVFPRVYSGSHLSHPHITFARTRRVRITLDRDGFTLYGGGEPLQEVKAGEPVEIGVEPGGLAVVG